MYEELNKIFPNQWWFYEVLGMTITEAMDRCSRMTGEPSHVINYQGRIVFASVSEIGNDNPWLVLIGGPKPVEDDEE